MKPAWKAFFRKWLRRLMWLPVLVLVFLVLLEIFYRNQWIDTYKRELNALNLTLSPAHPQKKVLVMGDSFSAAENSWVNVLRNRHPEWQIINSAVPGTTIFQANLMLAGRLATFKPDLLLYQVYVGNDLFDLRYPTNWSDIGFFRNVYWALANHVRSLGWLNYALGQLKRATALPDFEQGKVNAGEFDPRKYSERERLYLQAEPQLVENQVLLRGGRAEDMKDYLELFRAFLRTAAEAGCPVVVMVIPHCAQVNAVYAQRTAMIGGKGMDAAGLQEDAYPFWMQLAGLQGVGVRFINLLPSLREEEEAGQTVYYLHDAHLNAVGQEVVAEVVECGAFGY
jgi:hypothetical protein